MPRDDDFPLELVVDQRQPRAAQVYGAIRAAVLDLRLKPGTAISENRICRQTNVSRTPAREALIRLAQEGLIDVFPQHGSFIAPIRLKNVLEGHFIREALEIALLKRAAVRWNAGHAATIGKIIETQRTIAAARDYEAFYREDENFHRSFARIAEMDGVSAVIKDAGTDLTRVRKLANPFEGHMEAAIDDHQAILDALNAGDTEAAVAAMEQHLDQVFQTVRKLIQHHHDYFEDLSMGDMLRKAAVS